MSGEDPRVVPLRRNGAGAARCPICRKPTVPGHAPFCSARCAEIDLGRWLKGMYRVPTDEAPLDGDLPLEALPPETLSDEEEP